MALHVFPRRPPMSDLIRKFLNDNPHLAAKTRDWYKIRLTEAFKYFNNNDLQTVTDEDINEYFAYMMAEKFAWSTRNGAFTCLKKFFRWARIRKHIVDDPFDSDMVTRPPKIERQHRILTMDEIERMVKYEEEKGQYGQTKKVRQTGIRNAAILHLLLTTGIRRAELAAIDLDDLSDDGSEIFIKKAKGGQSRSAYPKPTSIRAIGYWLMVRPTTSNPALFVSLFKDKTGPRYHRLSDNSITRIVADAAKRSGVNIDGAAHALRRLYATEYSKNGSHFALQKLMGHKRIETTQGYVTYSPRVLKDLASKAGPELTNGKEPPEDG